MPAASLPVMASSTLDAVKAQLYPSTTPASLLRAREREKDAKRAKDLDRQISALLAQPFSSHLGVDQCQAILTEASKRWYHSSMWKWLIYI
jgi:hypothetical protein